MHFPRLCYSRLYPPTPSCASPSSSFNYFNMTSMASESVATILCNSKQTRFQITNYREVRRICHSLSCLYT